MSRRIHTVGKNNWTTNQQTPWQRERASGPLLPSQEEDNNSGCGVVAVPLLIAMLLLAYIVGRHVLGN